jgi:hypothetical protein
VGLCAVLSGVFLGWLFCFAPMDCCLIPTPPFSYEAKFAYDPAARLSGYLLLT